MARRHGSRAGPALLLVAAPWLAGGCEPAPDRRRELVRLLRHDCGSCHGLTLRGGLGPPLTPEALQGKARSMLVDTVERGRPGTPMPPWGPLLGDGEARVLVDMLLEGVPDGR